MHKMEVWYMSLSTNEMRILDFLYGQYMALVHQCISTAQTTKHGKLIIDKSRIIHRSYAPQ